MKEVLPFCLENDLNAPNFFDLCIKDGDIRHDAKPDKLVKAELDTIEARKQTYYLENW